MENILLDVVKDGYIVVCSALQWATIPYTNIAHITLKDVC